MTDHDNIKTILDAGKENAAHVESIQIGDEIVPCIVTPGSAVPLVDVLAVADKRADKPRRRVGTAKMQALDSFCEHVIRFKSEASAVFADATARNFVAVLNYHPAGATSDPAWGDHRAVYPCPLSTEWKAWGNGAEVMMKQDAFALLLLRNERDIAVGAGRSDSQPYPAPSDLMTLARTLESFSSATNKRTRDPRTGQVNVQFSEDSGIKGEIAIPPAFGIKIPIFEDSEPVLVEVGLRVEVKDGAALFVIGVNDASKVLRAAFIELVDRVESATKLPVFIGTPE